MIVGLGLRRAASSRGKRKRRNRTVPTLEPRTELWKSATTLDELRTFFQEIKMSTPNDGPGLLGSLFLLIVGLVWAAVVAVWQIIGFFVYLFMVALLFVVAILRGILGWRILRECEDELRKRR